LSTAPAFITEAGIDDRVTQLLYVTSVMPDAGQSQADLVGSEPAPWLAPSDVAAETGDVFRLHRRPGDPGRGAAPTRQSRRPCRRV